MDGPALADSLTTMKFLVAVQALAWFSVRHSNALVLNQRIRRPTALFGNDYLSSLGTEQPFFYSDGLDAFSQTPPSQSVDSPALVGTFDSVSYETPASTPTKYASENNSVTFGVELSVPPKGSNKPVGIDLELKAEQPAEYLIPSKQGSASGLEGSSQTSYASSSTPASPVDTSFSYLQEHAKQEVESGNYLEMLAGGPASSKPRAASTAKISSTSNPTISSYLDTISTGEATPRSGGGMSSYADSLGSSTSSAPVAQVERKQPLPPPAQTKPQPSIPPPPQPVATQAPPQQAAPEAPVTASATAQTPTASTSDIMEAVSKEVEKSVQALRMMQEQQGQVMQVMAQSEVELTKMISHVRDDVVTMKASMQASQYSHSSLEARQATLEERLAAVEAKVTGQAGRLPRQPNVETQPSNAYFAPPPPQQQLQPLPQQQQLQQQRPPPQQQRPPPQQQFQQQQQYQQQQQQQQQQSPPQPPAQSTKKNGYKIPQAIEPEPLEGEQSPRTKPSQSFKNSFKRTSKHQHRQVFNSPGTPVSTTVERKLSPHQPRELFKNPGSPVSSGQGGHVFKASGRTGSTTASTQVFKSPPQQGAPKQSFYSSVTQAAYATTPQQPSKPPPAQSVPPTTRFPEPDELVAPTPTRTNPRANAVPTASGPLRRPPLQFFESLVGSTRRSSPLNPEKTQNGDGFSTTPNGPRGTKPVKQILTKLEEEARYVPLDPNKAKSELVGHEPIKEMSKNTDPMTFYDQPTLQKRAIEQERSGFRLSLR